MPLRIPYTAPFPPPTIHPPSAHSLAGSIAALASFLSPRPNSSKTLLLTGAGLSVPSGLPDYRGPRGTYTLRRNYRPVFYAEFVARHASRQRYFARSYLGWPAVERVKPNKGYEAVGALGGLGILGGVVTQNVDALHPRAHPDLPTIELHGSLHTMTCLSCGTPFPRADFQTELTRLNPAWAGYMASLPASIPGNPEDAPATTNPDGDAELQPSANPDGDVAPAPGAPAYETFRYPSCPSCLASPPLLEDGSRAEIRVDGDGAWMPGSSGGVLKPGVVMFGEGVDPGVRVAAERAVDEAGRVLVVGSSLATWSAWRLVRRMRDKGGEVGIVCLGGVRGEGEVVGEGIGGVRVVGRAEEVLPEVVEALRRRVDGGEGDGGKGSLRAARQL
ncbi:DHS-like NAD/FAD-binding domain-containing protein [Trichodelitschia bisporula]|uniref:DHS-like NAD/FAD-binding domain-containing protein n=1 Tax=Trichodelitschia bisporula TaxID=703511 RepID=A0A6G1HU88_9PEZI|nr:DHS-like NAD/FAD-binding domain-containing protein [Trichodelitschia bisporula]